MDNLSGATQNNTQPESSLALSFSAALDDLFNLNGLGALEEFVERKKDEVQVQKVQLSELDKQLREADERLRKLEIKYKRQSQMYTASRRTAVSCYPDGREDESSGDSDNQAQESHTRPH